MKTEKADISRKVISLIKRLFSLAALSLILTLVPAIAYADDVTLAWDANSEPDVTGYKLHYGTNSGDYSNSIDVGNVTQHTVSNLQQGETYYFAATAYDVNDAESDYSAEVAYTVNATSHTITASAGANGSIFPVGSLSVNNGSNQSFSISADQNYQILDVLVDGVSVGAASTYSFDNVSSNHTISASFVSVNQAPIANAGPDQTVTEGMAVTLNVGNSTDPGGSIDTYSWEQTEGLSVQLSNANSPQASFIAPSVGMSGETLRFRLTVADNGNLQSTDSCEVQVTKAVVEDSDGDGVPDDQDAFPFDAEESLDTDLDGQGNNADTDDDNDGMPDTWELVYGLNPLVDDATEDPDGDEVSNINEYHLGTEPDNNEGNFEPEMPVILSPKDEAIVSLTPVLETEDFFDPNVNDLHGQSQWQIMRTDDDVCVFDVTTESSLTELTVPKLVLEEDTDYYWRVKFSDHLGGASQWSEDAYFRTEFIENDSDGNGILDHQEVNELFDLDGDGVNDRDQTDIKCMVTDIGNFYIGISIKDSFNVESIEAIESEAPENGNGFPPNIGGPNFLAFDLVHFKLIVNQPGDEVEVTIYLSHPAYSDGTWYKYDPVNDIWLDYSEYTEFSSDRRSVFLRIKDGGFGDADGIENGIIVDPLAYRTVSNHNASSDSESFLEEFFEGLSDISCFITTAATAPAEGKSLNLWHEIRGRELSILFILILLALAGREVCQRINRYRSVGMKGRQSWREANKGWR